MALQQLITRGCDVIAVARGIMNILSVILGLDLCAATVIVIAAMYYDIDLQ
jgi:hypothetical protein